MKERKTRSEMDIPFLGSVMSTRYAESMVFRQAAPTPLSGTAWTGTSLEVQSSRSVENELNWCSPPGLPFPLRTAWTDLPSYPKPSFIWRMCELVSSSKSRTAEAGLLSQAQRFCPLENE